MLPGRVIADILIAGGNQPGEGSDSSIKRYKVDLPPIFLRQLSLSELENVLTSGHHPIHPFMLRCAGALIEDDR